MKLDRYFIELVIDELIKPTKNKKIIIAQLKDAVKNDINRVRTTYSSINAATRL